MLRRGDNVEDFEIVATLDATASVYLARRPGSASLDGFVVLKLKDAHRVGYVEEVASRDALRALLRRAQAMSTDCAQLEFDLSLEALRENDQTVKVAHEYDDDEVETQVGALPWLSIDDDSNTEVRTHHEPKACSRSFRFASRAGPSLYPSVEALIPTGSNAASSVPPRPRHRSRRGRAASLFSLGVLCLVFGVVLATSIQGEPAGSVRRLPASAAFRGPDAQLTTSQPASALPLSRTPVVRESRATLQDAGRRRPHAHRELKAHAKLAAHAKRAKLK